MIFAFEIFFFLKFILLACELAPKIPFVNTAQQYPN